MVTHQLQVELRTAKGHRPKTDALPLDHTTRGQTVEFGGQVALHRGRGEDLMLGARREVPSKRGLRLDPPSIAEQFCLHLIADAVSNVKTNVHWISAALEWLDYASIQEIMHTYVKSHHCKRFSPNTMKSFYND